MSAEKHTRNMLLALMAVLHDRAPIALALKLRKFGFAPGDVTFRRTKGSKRTWTEVHRWPWERSPMTPTLSGRKAGL